MNQEQINQALSSAINELTSKLAEELTTKNLLSAQLVEARQIIANLQAEVAGLTQQLDEITKLEEVSE
ncbi:TPA: hypothetical protein U1Y72_000635 [Streptococcus suis]|nr:hypothetical protein [Streptococcus suis]